MDRFGRREECVRCLRSGTCVDMHRQHTSQQLHTPLLLQEFPIFLPSDKALLFFSGIAVSKLAQA